MKIYNIDNPKAFFEKLSGCTGRVDMIGRDGERIGLVPQGDAARAMRALNFPIGELQIEFENRADCMRMLRYAAQMNIAS